MSGASFVALAGGIYFGGYQYLGFVIGWTGGYVLVNALLAPYLRKFGCYTVPDFIGTRYDGNFARFVAVIDPRRRLVHLRDGADHRHRHHRCARLRHPLRHRRLGRPARHPALLDARRHARRDLDPGGAVHRADHRLPGAGLLDVERPGPRPDPAVRLRRGGAGGRGARAAVRPQPAAGAGRRAEGAGDAALRPAGRRHGLLEVRHPRALHDGGHRVAAAHPDALLHHALGALGAQVGRLVAVLHLPALLHRPGARDADQAPAPRPGAADGDHRQGLRGGREPALDPELGAGRHGGGAGPERRRHRAAERVLHARRRGGARHARDRRPALRHLRPRRRGRHGGGDVDGGRAPARHRQRAEPRPLLQDHRPARPTPACGSSSPG